MMRSVLTVLLVSVGAVFELAPAANATAGVQPPLELSKGVQQDGNRTETKHLTLTTTIGAGGRGGRFDLVVTVEPKPKMHVYAPQQDDYIPITLTLTPTANIQVQKPRYPAAEKYFFAPLKETQLVYSKPFKILQPVTVTRTGAGAMTITGTVRYQACDDMICYLPQTVSVSWAIDDKGQRRRP